MRKNYAKVFLTHKCAEVIFEWSHRPLESSPLSFNAHGAHGFLTNDYLTVVGGESGMETFSSK